MTRRHRPVPLSAEDVGALLVEPRALVEWWVVTTDPHAWVMLAAWAGGAQLTWRQTTRVAATLAIVLGESGATAREQDEAAASYGPDTTDLLARARILAGF